jgi:YVTN family beta-propeller protein
MKMERKSDLQTEKKAGLLYFFLIGIVSGMILIAGCNAGDERIGMVSSPLPSVPTNVRTTAGDKQITISWDNVSGATSYNLYWSTSMEINKDNCEGEAPKATSPYIHEKLTNGTSYYYVVTAENNYGESDESSVKEAKPVYLPYLEDVIITIFVGNSPMGLAVSPDGEFVYVPNAIGNSVSVIQTADKRVIATVFVEDNPRDIAITPDGENLYVTNYEDGTVSVIQTSDRRVIATVFVGDNPRDIAITPDGEFVYVTNALSGTVSMIQTSDNAVIDTIPVEANPADIVVTPNGRYVYVTHLNEAEDDVISVIQTSDNAVVDIITVGNNPMGIAVSPDGEFVYVTNALDNTMSVIGLFESPPPPPPAL